MGRLISTGVVIDGHSTTITYQYTEQGQAATLTCLCGWSVRLEHFDKLWGISEVQRRFDSHLSDSVPGDAAQSALDRPSEVSTPASKRSSRPESWASVGVSVLPRLAPSFRIFGDNPSRIWALGFGSSSWRIDPLDDRWVVDVTEVPRQDGIHPGDAIAWIGEYGRYSGLCLWPPSRVLSVEHISAGKKSRIRSLRDSWLEPVRVKEIDDSYVGVTWKKAWKTQQAIPVSRACLQWWGLDVWCLVCGDLGKPTSFGLEPPPASHEDTYVEEWHEFHHSTGSCGDRPVGGMACARCGWQWGDDQIGDDQNYWPEDASVHPHLTPAFSRSDLMSLFNLPDFASLIEELDCYTEPDTYISEQPNGIEIQVGTGAVHLEYPMTIREIYETIDEMENAYYEETEE